MIFEIANPSDAYTIEGEILPCGVATMFLGEGKYGLKDERGETAMPIFLFGGHEPWLKENGGESLDAYVSGHRAEIATALESVLIGDFADRKRMLGVLACISDPVERAAAQAAWHDERRSSMNDIGARAVRLAKRLREPA